MDNDSYNDPHSRALIRDCPALAAIDWNPIEPREDGAALVYGHAASEVVRTNNSQAILELTAHLNRVFEKGDESQTTAATVGALESLAMTKSGITIARRLLSGESLRWFEKQTEWIKPS